jgi:hypothetical protein
MALIDTEEAARRLARAIASDILCYNDKAIEAGIDQDDLFDAIKDQIQEGRDLFQNRVSPELYRRNFYDRALIDIVVRAMGDRPSKMW